MQLRLRTFLNYIHQSRTRRARRQQSIRLLFYLGGHGEPGYYCIDQNPHQQQQLLVCKSSSAPSSSSSSSMGRDKCYRQNRWYYADIIHILDQKLNVPGDHVWMMVDTCYSGSLADVFQPPQRHRQQQPTPATTPYPSSQKHNSTSCYPRWSGHRAPPAPPLPQQSTMVPTEQNQRPSASATVSYYVLMSTTRDDVAGPEWTLTDGWIQAMAGTLPKLELDHTGDGTHTTTATAGTNNSVLSSQNVIDSIQDRIRRIKQNEMQFVWVGNDSSSNSTSSNRNCSKNPIHLNDPFPFSFIPPTTALNDDQEWCNRMENLQLSKHDYVSTSAKNEASSEKLPGTNQRIHLLTSIQIAQCLLARNGQFRDYSTFTTGTKLWIMWDDDHTRLYAATVVKDQDLSWENFIDTADEDDNVNHSETTRWLLPNPKMCVGVGPCIPVLWHKEQSLTKQTCRRLPRSHSGSNSKIFNNMERMGELKHTVTPGKYNKRYKLHGFHPSLVILNPVIIDHSGVIHSI
jgi:hypothetical protein